ncbi:type II toxin-antitoxin system VapB family antitoxin [Nocardioides sp.]|uniref:type II toxin-antitoxin system VapB family antitoxin n=1 Tax=Nocardioides sp. TaxID=35761 RepID=UPI0039E6343F
MRTTLTIDDELLEEAKGWAHARHLTLGELVEEALRLRILGDEEPRAFVPLPVFQGSGLLPGADATKNPWHWEGEDEPDENGLYHL